jgi:hypothetical protein
MTELDLFASKLNGRQYRNEITAEEELEAKEKGFLVVFGASDDLMEVRGVVGDEFNVYCTDSTLLFYFYEKESVIRYTSNMSDRPEYETVLEILQDFNVPLLKIKVEKYASRFKEGTENEFAWNYSTEANYATFDIFDDGENYCKGLVVDYKGYFEGLKNV